MNIFIDNTSLHAAGNAFSCTAADRSEVSELLQLAIWIIFSENISLNSFGPSEVVERTDLVINDFKSQGLPSGLMKVTHLDRELYLNACKTAAEDCIPDLDYYIENIRSSEETLVSRALPAQAIAGQAALIKMIIAGEGKELLAGILREPLFHRSYGAMGYMLALSGKLREVIRGMDQIRNWTPAELNNLNGFLRYYYTDALSRLENAKYAPSIGRATFFRKQHEILIDRISKNVDKAVSRYLNRTVTVPSLYSALIEKSHGAPEGIIPAALLFREKATELRKSLSHLIQDSILDDDERFVKETKYVNDIAESLESALGLKKTPTLWNAIDISFVIGIPSLKVSGAKLKEWLDYFRMRKKILILSEMSYLAAMNEQNSPGMDQLVKKCIKNTPAK
jgi:hypothetical protein